MRFRTSQGRKVAPEPSSPLTLTLPKQPSAQKEFAIALAALHVEICPYQRPKRLVMLRCCWHPKPQTEVQAPMVLHVDAQLIIPVKSCIATVFHSIVHGSFPFGSSLLLGNIPQAETISSSFNILFHYPFMISTQKLP